MEEDIKILEDMRDEIYGAMQFEDEYCVMVHEEKQFDALNLAIKIMKRYKELEEENKQLKEKWERDCHKIHEMVREEYKIKTNYIPISVIQNKIDELNKKTGSFVVEEINKEIIKYLQELLERRCFYG